MSGLEVALIILISIWSIIFIVIALGVFLIFLAIKRVIDKANKLLDRSGDVYLITYPGLVALCTSLEPKKKNPKKRHRVIDKKKLRAVLSIMTGIVLDESTAIMNHGSMTYKICNKFAGALEYRFALTGTPFGRDPQALWTQFYFVDRGETLGPTLGIFRDAFFTKKERYWGGYEYKFKGKLPKDRTDFLKMKGKKSKWTKKLHELLCNRSIFYDESECIELPPKSYQTRTVTCPEDTMVYYDRIKERLVAARGNYRVIKNSFLNMRQLASGFLGLKNDETGAGIKVEFPDNPKLDVLMELVYDTPLTSKMVIFHEYVWTGDKIASLLKAKGVKFERLGSGQKDPRLALRRFRTDPEFRYFIVNNHSGAFGLNLQVANYGVFVESPTAPIIRKQCEKRIRRSGQTKRVFFIDIVMKGTKDEQILEFLKEGEDLFQAIVAGKISKKKLAA